jgi:hypothetical protein
MARFVTQHTSALSPMPAWRRITDWPRHGRYIPLTSSRITTGGPNGVGTVFLARTGVGPLGFDDPMEIVEWVEPADDRPGRCRLEKRGSVMLGWAVLVVAPSPAGSRATWTEDISVAHLPGLFDPLTSLSSRLLFSRVLRRLLDDP